MHTRDAALRELRRWLELISPADRRVLARAWSAPGHDPDALLAVMGDPARVRAQWEQLGAPERAALEHVIAEGNALPVAIMQREHGAVREPQGFAHPRAYLDALRGPLTPPERLLMQGWLFRAHDQRGPIYRVPAALLAGLPPIAPRERRLELATAPPPQQVAADALAPTLELALALLWLAYDGALLTLQDGALAKAALKQVAGAVRDAPEVRAMRREADWPALALLRGAMVGAGLLRRDADGRLRPTAEALPWLRAAPSEQVARLVHGWQRSPLDELTLLCGLRWRGGAPYSIDWHGARRRLLALLITLPAEAWWALDAVSAAVQRVDAAFLRRDGRFDTWLLYDAQDRLVSGWEHWERVEGALIRAVARGPLHWFGLVELDAAGERMRWTRLGAHLLQGAPAPSVAPPVPLIVQATFDVVCPPGASLYARFQLRRIAELKQADLAEVFTLTRRALLAATERGIQVEDALRFLREYSGAALPPAVEYSLREWSRQRELVTLEQAVLLRVSDPVVLAQLRAEAGPALADAEVLSATLVRLSEAQAEQVAERLRRAGVGLRDERVDPQRPLDERDLRALATAAVVYARLCAALGLPCEVEPAALRRIARLVPPRQFERAVEAARAVLSQLGLPDGET
ncbi:helicase-associated domain-containing protein [Kallotenue papyrolyticum]|uniref:helicase-associated domain-containing protein n=1 Tax=Kallotenue papyrolyticum TaxID=1325125 RepID=UPI0004785994|nr:helicase-associated domain-containing protein [Kallotenue papyrolyticum]